MFGFVACDDFSDIFDDERPFLDVLQSLDAPTASVRCSIDRQNDFSTFLNHPIRTFGATLAPLVALKDGRAWGLKKKVSGWSWGEGPFFVFE